MAAEQAAAEGGSAAMETDPTGSEPPVSPVLSPEPGSGQIKFRVVFKSVVHEVVFGLDQTIGELKAHLEGKTGCPASVQKLSFKGPVKDDSQTLKERKFTPKCKVLLIGPTAEDLLQQASMAGPVVESDPLPGAAVREPEVAWCEQAIHRKVLDKGIPPDVEMGYMPLDGPEPVPTVPLVLFDYSGKIRLSFKMAEQMLVIGTKERTRQVPLSSIYDCKSEPIAEHPAYHIMAMQLGPTEKSIKFFYWVPAQYVKSIIVSIALAHTLATYQTLQNLFGK